MVAAMAVGVWAVWFTDRRHGGLVLILMSVLLLLVGGGFGPPFIGIMIGVAAARMGFVGRRPVAVPRALGRAWPWLLVAAVLGYLSLVPGAIILDQLLDADIAGLVAVLTAFSFATLILALVAARGRDRLRAGATERPSEPDRAPPRG